MLETGLKAYIVQETDEMTGGVVYAEDETEAERAARDEHGWEDEEEIVVERAEWADRYAPGPCPLTELYHLGWWFKCDECGRRMQIDDSPCDSPVGSGSSIYCSMYCRNQCKVRREIESCIKKSAISNAKLRLLAILPGAILLDDGPFRRPHVYIVNREAVHVSIPFTFPGQQFGICECRRETVEGEWNLYVPNGDRDAFKAWRESGHDRQEASE